MDCRIVPTAMSFRLGAQGMKGWSESMHHLAQKAGDSQGSSFFSTRMISSLRDESRRTVSKQKSHLDG
jgi:hypothetical protein